MNDAKTALYQIVPAVYRNRDTGDLEKYFASAAVLLDQIQSTLEQKMADNFPDNPIDGSLACQEWLLPYFADLLDVRLISPLAEGKRNEISKAVRWRQGKGTLSVIEDIAQSIGQIEFVVQEGWQRVAATSRLNIPRPPSSSFGYANDIPQAPPSIAARHPSVNAVTPDFSCPSAAVAALSGNPGAEQSTVDGETVVWRQASFHGAPCHPGSFDDVSRRTVDFRCPDWRVGHYHPDRVLLYMLPPAGFFPPDIPSVNWTETFSEQFLELIEVIEDGVTSIYTNRTWGSDNYRPVRVRRVIKLGQDPDGVGDADVHTWVFKGLILENTVEADSGRVILEDCAARKVEVHSIDYHNPVITAKNCLVKQIQAARGVSRLEYCTVLESTLSEIVYASDCIFFNLIRKDHATTAAPDRGCLRYCAVHKNQQQGGLRYFSVTHQPVIFFSEVFGERSCGVLHPASDESVRHGAEDGGEIGAYHAYYYSFLAEAVVEKLNDFLPLGIETAVIPNVQLLSLTEA